MPDKNKEMAMEIARKAALLGGRAYYVGGYVRDGLLGRVSKDIDLEIHGLLPQTLEAVLDSLGTRTVMGASFGIYALKHYDLDISLPRGEGGHGRGKDDFTQYADPFVGTREAARRRDFTMNSLMQDVLTGELLDPFGGETDLKQGILRHVDDETFREDPLRVLRAAGFAARFGLHIAEETKALCAGLNLKEIARERIYAETQKAFLKSDKPSVYFESLRAMNQLDIWYPEVQALIGTVQDPLYHPEGDVWNHTMQVLDRAAALRSRAEYPEGLMFAALCHDFGKTEAMQVDGNRIRALGHETAGVPLAERFLSRMTGEKNLIKYVRSLVQLHMRPNLLASQNSGQKALNRLYDSAVSPQDLLLLAKADAPADVRDYGQTEAFLLEGLAVYREMMARPYVKGADLVAAGFRPGADFSEALTLTHKLRLAGVGKDEALKQAAAFLRKTRSEQS